MRIVTLPMAFLILLLSVFPGWVLADSAPLASGDRQFQPKSYVAPSLHSAPTVQPTVAPTRKKRTAVKLKSKRQTISNSRHTVRQHPQRAPLEVQRLKVKKTPHLSVTPPLSQTITAHRPDRVKKVMPSNLFYQNLKRHQHLSHAGVHPGSLRLNIQRIAEQHGWHRVIWMLPEDYRWVGETRVTGHGLPGILEKLLASYPVQAEFYQGNHVLVIHPRTI